MNNINPIKINGVIKEIGSKKEVVKETVQKATEEVKTQASTLGRDLVKTVKNESPNVSISELTK